MCICSKKFFKVWFRYLFHTYKCVSYPNTLQHPWLFTELLASINGQNDSKQKYGNIWQLVKSIRMICQSPFWYGHLSVRGMRCYTSFENWSQYNRSMLLKPFKDLVSVMRKGCIVINFQMICIRQIDYTIALNLNLY